MNNVFQADASRMSKNILLIVIIILCVIVGILMASIYFLKKEINQPQTSVNPAIYSLQGANSKSQNFQPSNVQNKFLSFSATVKNINGNTVTLTNLPNSTGNKRVNGELNVTISGSTKITKVESNGNQASTDMSQAPAVPATLSDIKKDYQVFVELSEPADLSANNIIVDAKSIRITGGPDFK